MNAKIFFVIILMLLSFYICNNIGYNLHSAPEAELTEQLTIITDTIDDIMSLSCFRISTELKDIVWGLTGICAVGLIALYISTLRHNFRYGEEHGSARWGTRIDIAKLIDKTESNNMIFTQTEKISLNTRKTMRNNNVLVVGGSGSGKTRFFLKPNLMQMHSSYVVTDPNGLVC